MAEMLPIQQGVFDPYKLAGIKLTDQELGRGSYASVVKLEYKGLKCAGKKLYPVLHKQGRRHGHAQHRFVEECRLLSQLRHPNIVQFLGVYFHSDEYIPMLVMEFLPTNLTSCIEQYDILPKDINYSILHDVSLGLNYLHTQTPPIIHRDLSSNNVLLTTNMTAKISDLGVARILNLTPMKMNHMTGTPGTPAFMPPEVMVADPRYDTSVDIFSYGVMMIHVFSGEWPVPNCEPIHIEPNGQMAPVSEAERRREYLYKIGHDHPLMDLILKCVNNRPQQRGRIDELVDRMTNIVSQFPPSFANTVEMMGRIKALKEEKKILVAEVKEKNEEVEHGLEQKEKMRNEIALLKEYHRHDIECSELVHSTEVEQLQLQIEDLKAQLEIFNHEIKTLQADNKVLREAYKTHKKELEARILYLEGEIANMLLEVTGQKFVNDQMKTTLISADQQLTTKEQEVSVMADSLLRKESEIISKISDLTQKDATIGRLSDQLIQQKSENKGLKTKLFLVKQEVSLMAASLTRKESEISSKRKDLDQKDAIISGLNDELAEQKSANECLKTALSLIEQDNSLMTNSLHTMESNITSRERSLTQKDSTIRRLNNQLTKTRQYLSSKQQTLQAKMSWKECTSLPIAASGGSTCVIKHKVYFGGFASDDESENIVYCYDPSKDNWSTLSPLPVRLFGLGQVKGKLVTIGGEVVPVKITNVLHVFSESSQKWKLKLPPMGTARTLPTVISHSRALIVAGGWSVSGCVNTIEIYNIDTCQWCSTDPLPTPFSDKSPALVFDTCYLIGGYSSPSQLSSVACASIDQILSNCVSPTNSVSKDDEVYAWKELANTPSYRPTAAVILGTLFAIGGSRDSSTITKETVQNTVYMYSPSIDSWVYVCNLPTSLFGPVTASLLPSEFLVIGGSDGASQVKTVYKGTINMA